METPGVGLSFSGFTYEELRAMVYDTDLRDLTTAQNRWGLFKRSIDERIGLLHVLIAQIQPAWRGEAGQAAVAAFQQYVDWLTAVSEVAAQNRETLGDLHTAQTQAILAMRELDAQEGGPAEVVRDPNSLDEPLPPRLADRRQPRAVEIVNDLFQAWLRAYSNIETPPPPNRYVNRQWTPPRVESTSETFSNEKISTFSGREDNSSTNDSQPANSSPIPPFNDREFTGGDPQPDEPLPDITPHPPFNPGPILSGPGGVTPGGATPTPPTTSPPVGVSPPGIGGPPLAGTLPPTIPGWPAHGNSISGGQRPGAGNIPGGLTYSRSGSTLGVQRPIFGVEPPTTGAPSTLGNRAPSQPGSTPTGMNSANTTRAGSHSGGSGTGLYPPSGIGAPIEGGRSRRRRNNLTEDPETWRSRPPRGSALLGGSRSSASVDPGPVSLGKQRRPATVSPGPLRRQRLTQRPESEQPSLQLTWREGRNMPDEIPNGEIVGRDGQRISFRRAPRANS